MGRAQIQKFGKPPYRLDDDEKEALCYSEAVCHLADMWAQWWIDHDRDEHEFTDANDRPLWSAIDVIEAATQDSPLRKVKYRGSKS